jgi:methyltransferase OMS1, mitochondrial
MLSKRTFAVGGAFVYMGAVYAAFNYFAPEKEKIDMPRGDEAPTKDERLNVMNKIAKIYDTELVKNRTEWWVGITKMRRNLIGKAEGRVLEIAGGTGKNLSHYKDTVEELLVIDSSEMMVQSALWKLRSLQNDRELHLKPNTRVHFRVLDAEHLSLPDDSFDTVVDTYGLCSFDDPVAAVREMARVCKPGGRILLLEHGRSTFHTWINTYILDQSAITHSWKYGCTWNRDIPQIIREAGLEVVSEKRRHFGTNYIIEAVPTKPKE